MAENAPLGQMNPHDQPDYQFSTLEVDRRKQEGNLEVDRRQQEGNLEVDRRQNNPRRGPALVAGSQPAADASAIEGSRSLPPNTICGIRRRIFWLVAGILAACVIVGAVVGGVLGSPKGDGSDKATTTPSTTPSPSPNSNYSTPSTKLTSVAYIDTSGNSFRHIFYQANDTTVREHGWNSTSRAWFHLSDLGSAKQDTPIAAAATLWTSLNIQLQSPEDFFIEIWARDPSETDNAKWKQGGLQDMNLKVLDNTDMASTWFRREGCINCDYNLHLFYQNENGALIHGNSSGIGWIMKDASALPVSRKGTPISFTQTWMMSNNQTDLMVFYEQEDGRIVQVQWNGVDQVDDNIPTSRQETLLDGASGATDLAAFIFAPANSAANERVLGLLASGDDGVTSFIKAESDSKWTSSVPAAMKSLDRGTPVAANEDGHAYGIENGVVKEFIISFDGQSWDWTETSDLVYV